MGLDHDPDVVARLASEIREAASVLDELAAVDREEFLADHHRVASAKYHLLVVIEGCLDLANHVISANGYRMPEDYADTFEVLADEDVLDPGFAEELARMAQFRNRLVHVYWDVDDELVHDYIRERREDVRRFLEDLLSRIRDGEDGG